MVGLSVLVSCYALVFYFIVYRYICNDETWSFLCTENIYISTQLCVLSTPTHMVCLSVHQYITCLTFGDSGGIDAKKLQVVPSGSAFDQRVSRVSYCGKNTSFH